MNAGRFPLSWPPGWKRTPRHERRRARFQSVQTRAYSGGVGSYRQKAALSVSQALDRLQHEMRRLGVFDGWLVSTNVRTRLDGLPYSNGAEPDDPGVAIYFRLNRKDRCLASDRWDRVADNIAAIAGHIEALRTIDRYGVGTMDQAFAGYTALAPTAEDWWLVFDVPRHATLEQVETAYRTLARTQHPDAGGTTADMTRLNTARDRAKTEIVAR